MIEYIIGAIALMLFIGLIGLVSIATVSINHVKCPKCGNDMDYMGNVLKITKDKKGIVDNSNKVKVGYPHAYRCPKCGKIRII